MNKQKKGLRVLFDWGNMIQEKRTLNGDKVDTLKIPITPPDGILKEYPGMEVMECYVVLYKPRIPEAEAEKYKAAVDGLKQIDLSTALKVDLVDAIKKATDPMMLIVVESVEIKA
jgi:hypothetical protein